MPITYLGIAALVVSGGHYTMDVLIAYWLTSKLYVFSLCLAIQEN